MLLRAVVASILFVALGAAHADEARLNLLSKQDLLAFEAQVNKDFREGNRYREISPTDQESVTKAFARMDTRWQQADANGNLNANQTIEMVNDQQIVATILRHAAADSRLVCEDETPMGTRISKNVCRTVGQIKREQDSSQGALRDMQAPGQQKKGGG